MAVVIKAKLKVEKKRIDMPTPCAAKSTATQAKIKNNRAYTPTLSCFI